MCVGLCCANLVKLGTVFLRISFPVWSCVSTGQKRNMPSKLSSAFYSLEVFARSGAMIGIYKRGLWVPVCSHPPPLYICVFSPLWIMPTTCGPKSTTSCYHRRGRYTEEKPLNFSMCSAFIVTPSLVLQTLVPTSFHSYVRPNSH